MKAFIHTVLLQFFIFFFVFFFLFFFFWFFFFSSQKGKNCVNKGDGEKRCTYVSFCAIFALLFLLILCLPTHTHTHTHTLSKTFGTMSHSLCDLSVSFFPVYAE